MYRFLEEVLQNPKNSQADVWSGILPQLKILSLSVIGLILGHPKTQLVPKETFKLLSKLVFVLFLPCLIFIRLGKAITLENVALWWFIPVNVLVSTLIGFVLGIVVVIICHPPAEFARFTIIMTAFGNTGNLALAIVASICHTADNPFGQGCHHTGMAYVSFAQWVAVILVYTLVYHMMEPPLEYYEVVEEGDEVREEQQDANSRPLLVEAEWPGMEDKQTQHSKSPFIAKIFHSVTNMSQLSFPDLDQTVEGNGGSFTSIQCLAAPRVVRKIRIVAEQTPIKHVLQPPTIASFLAIVVGMMPQIKSAFFGHDAPLSFATDSLEILAGAMVPSVMLILGGMLAEGPNESKLGIKTTVGIIVARLFVLPIVGFGIVTLAGKLHFLVEGDQMYRFVLLLQYTTPSAILLAAIASLRGYAVKEASALLFWQHLIALFSLSLYFVVYFKLELHA